MNIVTVTGAPEADDARQLMRDFIVWHRSFHAADIARVDRYFDAAAFEAEILGLPGTYAAPSGALLVAYRDDRAVGCVAMRDMGDGNCEMKRMFVRDEVRGTGAGRALGEGIIEAARNAGYSRMRLDTGADQIAAITLYEKLGFRRIPPYYDLPSDLRDWLLFFELDLEARRRLNSNSD